MTECTYCHEPEHPVLYCREQLADMLRVSPDTIDRRTADGRISHLSLGEGRYRYARYPKAMIDAWLLSGVVMVTDVAPQRSNVRPMRRQPHVVPVAR